MPINEQVRAVGDWSLRFRGDLPRSLTVPLETLWSELVITPARLPAEALGYIAPTVEDPDPVPVSKDIAVVIGDPAAPTAGDWRLDWLLRSFLGHAVTFIADTDAEVDTSSSHHLVVVAPSADPASIGTKYRAAGADALPVLHLNADAWTPARSALIASGAASAVLAHQLAALAGGDTDFVWPGVTYDGATLRQLHAAAELGQAVTVAQLHPGATAIAAPVGDLADVAAFSLDVGDAARTARVVAIGTTEALLDNSVWSAYTDLVGAAIEWLAPATTTAPPVPSDPSAIWLLGKSAVSPTGVFVDPTEEASASALVAAGHNVTRVQTSTLTGPPLVTDCGVVVHLDGHPPDWRWLRGTATDAAPIWHTNAYFAGDAFGYSSGSYYYGAALTSSTPGTGRALAYLEVAATSPVTWSAGYTAGQTPQVFDLNYVEWTTAGTSTFTTILSDPLNASRAVGWVADAGATNVDGDTLTARQAVVCTFPVGFHAVTDAGLELAADIMQWLAGGPSGAIDPPDPAEAPAPALTTSSIDDVAIYAGIVRTVNRTRDDVTLAGPGLAAWLGEAENGQRVDIPQAGNGSFAIWIDALLPPGIGRGLVTTPAGGDTYTATYTNTTPRKALDDVCDYFGAEWRMRPSGRLDAGPADAIYGSGPAAYVIAGAATVEGDDPRALTGATVDVTYDAENYLTAVDAIGSAVTGTAHRDDVAYRDRSGAVLERRGSINASEVTVEAEADALAAAELDRSGVDRVIRVTVDEALPTLYAPVGCTVGVYDPATDCHDLDNPVRLAGRTVFPLEARLRRARWPVRRGCGVYLRSAFGASAGRIVDVTDYVVWETGPATLEVDSVPVPAAVLRARR
jgi:hypothetical protein